MSLLTELQDELTVAREAIEPQVEGLADFGRLNITTATAQAVEQARGAFQRRHDLLAAALAALKTLDSDGYPDVPPRVISQEAFADLQANILTLGSAFAIFNAEEPVAEATHVTITAGIPRPPVQ